MRRAALSPVVALLGPGLVLLATPARALDPRRAITQYSHRAWLTEDGLPQRSVQAILQTRDGYLWLGTQEGLVRFDGVRFTVFDKQTTDAIHNNNVQALAEGRDGSLWIGTGGGGLVREKDGVFTVLTTEQGLPNASLWAILEARDGTVWLGTAGGGLARLREGRFSTLTTRDGLGSDHVLALLEDRNGTLWAGTDGGGLARVRGRELVVYTKKNGLPSDTVYSLTQDRAGSLWVGTAKGLVRFRDDAVTTFTTRDGLLSDRVEALLEDREGNLWVGTYGGGLSRLKGGRFTTYAKRDGLSNDMVKALYEDEEGSLWIGTRTGGLNRLKDGKVLAYSPREGLSHDLVWTVYEDREGAVFIGTDGGGLNRLADGRFTVYTKKDGLSHDMVRSVIGDRDGNLWIGTAGGGLNRLKDGRFTVYTTKDGLSHNFVRALYVDHEGTLWIGTYGGGLNRFRDGRFTAYTTRDGLGNDTVYCLLESRSGALWIGTRGGGLSSLRDGRLTTLTAHDGLSDEVVLSLHEDDGGALWIGTTGGLNRLKDGRLRAITAKDGLFDDVAYQILEDGRGNLWMSSNKGIYRARQADLEAFLDGRASRVTSESFGKADGMKAAECNGGVYPAGWKTRDGRLWFPTIRGVAVVDPGATRRNRRPPPVVVEEALVDRQPVDTRGAIEAPPGRGELHFRYAGLGFLAPDKVRFKRKLEGFDADWVDAGSRREADYTNIPPGRYVFRVIACNEDGVWNEAGAVLPLRLLPHVYQTSWFRVLALLAVGMAGVAAYRLRVARLERRRAALERLVDERTRDLTEATRRLEATHTGLKEAIRVKDEVVSIVAHHFRAPLGVIQSCGSVLETRAPDEDARRVFGIINAQARHLAALAEDTLTLSRIETGSLPLERRTVRIVDVARAIVEARTSTPGADVALDASEAELAVTGDPARLYQVIDNLVGNAIKYSPDGAHVRVAVGRTAEGIEIAVSDRGLGISPEEMPRLFRRFSRLSGARHRRISGTGLGLYICHSIVVAHGGRIWAESRPGEGSTFRFVLPAPHEAVA